MADDRVRMRIHRLERRVARLARALEAIKRWDERKHHPLRAFILEILDEDPTATDEEIADALVEKADELMRFAGIAELVTDLGLRLVANVGLWVHHNRERLITQRINRLRKRIAALQKELAKKPSRARGARAAREKVAPAAQDERSIFAAIGMSEGFVEAAVPKARKPRASGSE
jgi:hypothetical protein